MILLLRALRADKWSSGLGGFIGICRQSTGVCGWFPVEIRSDGAAPALRTSSLLQVHVSNVQLLVPYISRTCGISVTGWTGFEVL